MVVRFYVLTLMQLPPKYPSATIICSKPVTHRQNASKPVKAFDTINFVNNFYIVAKTLS